MTCRIKCIEIRQPRAIFIVFLLLVFGMAPSLLNGADKAPRWPAPKITGEPAGALANPLAGTNVPLIAIWKDSEGMMLNAGGPYLRVAVWPDGRVVFARNPNVWSNDLMIGIISTTALENLKNEIRKTGIFKLKGNCYLVPDASVDCLLAAFDGSPQILYWDEVEVKNYGINIDPQPQHIAFKKAWWEVNRLVLSALPSEARKLEAKFSRPPKAWYPKEMIQSE